MIQFSSSVKVCYKAKSLMKAEGCSILLYNQKTNQLEFDVALCREESIADILKSKVSLDVGQGIAGWVAEHGANDRVK